MTDQISDEEALDPTQLAALHREKLAAMLRAVLPSNSFWRQKIGEIGNNPATIALADLPLTTREEIQLDQADHPPYGTNLSFSLASYCRIHQTSGTSTGAPLRSLD